MGPEFSMAFIQAPVNIKHHMVDSTEIQFKIDEQLDNRPVVGGPAL